MCQVRGEPAAIGNSLFDAETKHIIDDEVFSSKFKVKNP